MSNPIGSSVTNFFFDNEGTATKKGICFTTTSVALSAIGVFVLTLSILAITHQLPNSLSMFSSLGNIGLPGGAALLAFSGMNFFGGIILAVFVYQKSESPDSVTETEETQKGQIESQGKEQSTVEIPILVLLESKWQTLATQLAPDEYMVVKLLGLASSETGVLTRRGHLVQGFTKFEDPSKLPEFCKQMKPVTLGELEQRWKEVKATIPSLQATLQPGQAYSVQDNLFIFRHPLTPIDSKHRWTDWDPGRAGFSYSIENMYEAFQTRGYTIITKEQLVAQPKYVQPLDTFFL